MSRISFIVRAILIVGLIVSPLYPRAFASDGHPMKMSPIRMESVEHASAIDADQAMPCHEGMMGCSKVCPCMAACMSLCAQGLPSPSGLAVNLAVMSARVVVHHEAQLASLAAPPPARPPRA